MYGPGECKSKLQDERRVVKNEFQPILDRCRQMSPNVAKCHQMSPNVAKCRQMSPNVAKCRQMSPCRHLATLSDGASYMRPIQEFKIPQITRLSEETNLFPF